MKKEKWKFFRKTPKAGWGVGIERENPYYKKGRKLTEIIKNTLSKKMPTS